MDSLAAAMKVAGLRDVDLQDVDLQDVVQSRASTVDRYAVAKFTAEAGSTVVAEAGSTVAADAGKRAI